MPINEFSQIMLVNKNVGGVMWSVNYGPHSVRVKMMLAVELKMVVMVKVRWEVVVMTLVVEKRGLSAVNRRS